ncbi:MAG: hypothetical protein JRD68_05735 [Deltaproteobacteria bacterium]|nr:hypothetical protein [Deltaproteobacteria bacterium]
MADKKRPGDTQDRDISTVKKLEQAILDFLWWMKSREHKRNSGRMRYQKILADFVLFVDKGNVSWDDIFTLETMIAFRKYHGQAEASPEILPVLWSIWPQSPGAIPPVRPSCWTARPIRMPDGNFYT